MIVLMSPNTLRSQNRSAKNGPWRRAKRRAQVLEGVAPAKVDPYSCRRAMRAGTKALPGLYPVPDMISADGLLRAEVVHLAHDRGADRAADQDRVLARIGALIASQQAWATSAMVRPAGDFGERP